MYERQFCTLLVERLRYSDCDVTWSSRLEVCSGLKVLSAFKKLTNNLNILSNFKLGSP